MSNLTPFGSPESRSSEGYTEGEEEARKSRRRTLNFSRGRRGDRGCGGGANTLESDSEVGSSLASAAEASASGRPTSVGRFVPGDPRPSRDLRGDSVPVGSFRLSWGLCVSWLASIGLGLREHGARTQRLPRMTGLGFLGQTPRSSGSARGSNGFRPHGKSPRFRLDPS